MFPQDARAFFVSKFIESIEASKVLVKRKNYTRANEVISNLKYLANKIADNALTTGVYMDIVGIMGDIDTLVSLFKNKPLNVKAIYTKLLFLESRIQKLQARISK